MDPDIHDLNRVINNLWKERTSPHLNFRTLVDVLLTNNLQLRNSHKRNIRISDLSISPSISLNHSANPKTLVALVIKCHQDTMYYGCLRHRYVNHCPHAAIAMYLFTRLHFQDNYGNTELDSNQSSPRSISPSPGPGESNSPRFQPVLSPRSNQLASFSETTLIRGNTKSQAISPSQQQKSIDKALKQANLDTTFFGSFRFMSLHEPEILESPKSSNIDNLPQSILAQYAGFPSIDAYNINRDILQPPPELVSQIFPFINDGSTDIFGVRINHVLNMLRTSLVQDMVVIKRYFPFSPVLEHPIFNCKLFEDFCEDFIKAGGLEDQISPDSLDFINKSPSTASSSAVEPTLNSLMTAQAQQKSQIHHLQNQVDFFMRQQASIYHDLERFMVLQNNFYNQQIGYLKSQPSSRNLNDSLSTSLDLLSRLNRSQQNFFSIINNPVYQQHQPGGAPHIPQVPHQVLPHQIHQGLPHQLPHQPSPQIQHVQQTPSQVQHTPIKRETPIKQEMMPLAPVFVQVPRQLPVPMGPQIGQIGSQHGHQMGEPPLYPHFVPSQVHPPPIIESEHSINRRKALYRKLSRQPVNVYEMWQDFKSLEKQLEENDVSITEWLKLHGSSERQFRHTRMKIVRFIEEEAKRLGVSVDEIKDKLHNTMRNRAKPWTLDEVQRMLSSGRKIDLGF